MLIGLIVMIPSPPLPAGTLVGSMVLFTVMVNPGVTASTVRLSAGVVMVCEIEGAVPVTVML